MKTFKYTISLLLLLTSVTLYGQDVKISKDTTTADWIKYIPTSIRVGGDLIAATRTYLKNDFTELNFQADIDFYRYFLNVEYGKMTQTLRGDESPYEVSGSYYGIGPDINFLYRDPDHSALFFGLRYSFSRFSDKLNYHYINPVYGDGELNLSNNSLRADWYELVMGMKVKLYQFVWFGYTARFKFGIDTFEDNNLIPNYIPGFGLAENNVSWGFNYYFIIRIPFRKSPEIPAKDK